MAAAPAEQRPAVLALTRLLDAPLQARRRRSRAALGSPAAQQVELSDGRLLYGQLQCADKQGNLVLHSTREVLPKSGAERTLGLVLVPRRHRVDVKARAEDAAEAEAQQG